MIDLTITKLVNAISQTLGYNFSKFELEKELNTYISNTFEKFRYTKNLLFRNEPVDFFFNYIPVTLNSATERIKLRNPLDVIENFEKIAIVGNAGSGKTTLLKYITLSCIDHNGLIPVYIELRLFGGQLLNFDDFVANSVGQSYHKEIKALFKNGDFVFLFDGFDEINFVDGESAISQIQSFISRYNKNKFVISSRPGTNIESLNEFHVYDIAPLDESDIVMYLERLQISNSKKDLFYKSIEEDSSFHQYLTSPLFLSIYLDYIISHDTLSLPRNKTIFFRNIIDTLFSKHDAVSKLGFVRTKLSGLNKDELETVSTVLAFRALLTSYNTYSKDALIKELELIKRNQSMFFENDNLIYDLTITVNILVVNGNYYSFPHILILEYLASLFITRLPSQQKIIFYEKILGENKILLTSSLLNFLFELDYQVLIKDFIIPELEKNRFSNKSDLHNGVLSNFLQNKFDLSDGSYGSQTLVNKLKKQYRIDNNDLGELFSL